ncbi:uncharacterized protein [Drosophila takahashii]|uniref:uncharacterized protein isoform X1 n=1 Tax=Drosophila takahashii TaxID=29030 RepID=UPI00389940A9
MFYAMKKINGCQCKHCVPIKGPNFPGLRANSGKGILDRMRLAKEQELRASRPDKYPPLPKIKKQENIRQVCVECSNLLVEIMRKQFRYKLRKLSAGHRPPKRSPFCSTELEKWTRAEISNAFDRLKAKRFRKLLKDGRDFQPTKRNLKKRPISSRELKKWTRNEVENALDRFDRAGTFNRLRDISRFRIKREF